ncbi:MAG TPA: hypothetical protein VGY52_09345 [Roseiarcus sp.]|jgi:2-aminoethylphosphonate transport system permease protein|nr:hypothetical protein [Roseiarcus sp.]
MSDAALPARARRLRPDLSQLWIVPPGAILALLFFYPLALIVRQALSGESGAPSLDEFAQVLHARFFLNALLNTATIAAAATSGCLSLDSSSP